MRIGIPTEVKDHEYRVALTPAGARALTDGGHEVLVQAGAGAGSGLPDEAYRAAGARVVPAAEDAWAAELVCKVKEPVAAEYPLLRRDQTLFTYLHLAASRACTQALLDAGTTAVAYETVEAPDGSKIELKITCPTGWTDWMAAIDIIAKSAQAAGINIKAATPDYGAWNTALQGGTFDMTLNNWASMSNTPWTLYNLLFRHPIQEQMQSGNFGRYDNKTAFDLVDALAKVPADDEAGMKAAVSKIQELMLTDMPMIPLWYNGLWAQWSDSTWTNWTSEGAEAPKTLPTTWSGYWQLGGLQTLINLKPVTK